MKIYNLVEAYSNIYQPSNPIYDIACVSTNYDIITEKLNEIIDGYKKEGLEVESQFVGSNVIVVAKSSDEYITLFIQAIEENKNLPLNNIAVSRKACKIIGQVKKAVESLKDTNVVLYDIIIKKVKEKGYKETLAFLEEVIEDGFETSIFDLFPTMDEINEQAKRLNLELSDFISQLNKDVRALETILSA